jgi:phage shock protein C
MGETTGGVLRRGSERIIGGVCSGLAAYFRVDPLVVRILFVILSIPPVGVGILLYLALWFLMEPPGGLPAGSAYGWRERLGAMRGELREDFRGGFHHAQSDNPPSGAPAPPPPAPPAPPPAPHHGWPGAGYRGRPSGLWMGVILIVIGAWFLLDNLGILGAFRWDIFWPIVLIAIGLLVLVRRPR